MANWRMNLKNVAAPASLMWDEGQRIKFSRDYYHFSPVLETELDRHVAECIARPETWEEFEAILEVACSHSLPVTVRGAGTGNYGQAVPMSGGLVLDMTRLNRVLDISFDGVLVEAGCRMGKLEAELRAHGREMRMFPSTFQSATIGGFVCGGSGGIGSITWGTLHDGLVRAVYVRSLTPGAETRRIDDPHDLRPYLHAYGTTGILTALELNTAPMVRWEQWAIVFDDITSAMAFGRAVAVNTRLAKRLVSVHEWPIPQYFAPLKLPDGKAAALLEIGEDGVESLGAMISEYRGFAALHLPASQYHRGTGVSDFTWNHTTLWARKYDSQLTYLQVRFDPDDPVRQLRDLQNEFPEFLCHIEWIRDGGRLTAAGLPIVRYLGESRLWQLIRRCEELGMSVANPHTWQLELGGRAQVLAELWRVKRANDPQGLLNQGKLGLEEDLKTAQGV